MNASHWVIAVAALMGIAAVSAGVGRAGSSAMLPGEQREALRVLRMKFVGMAGANPTGSGVQADVERLQPFIGPLLQWAMASDENAMALADELLEPMAAFAERFRLGARMDEALLRTQAYVVGTEPEHGLTIGTYLLLELAREKRSPAAVHTVLSAALAVFDGYERLADARGLHHYPESRQEGDRIRTELGGIPSGFGAEIAWVCEQFVLTQAASQQPILPEAAVRVAREYVQWREERSGQGTFDHLGEQFHIMAFVRRLVAALPAVESGAWGPAAKRRSRS